MHTMPTIDIAAEVEALGLFAACCDVWSCNPSTPLRERERLASRAERYRELQLDALEQYERNRK